MPTAGTMTGTAIMTGDGTMTADGITTGAGTTAAARAGATPVAGPNGIIIVRSASAAEHRGFALHRVISPLPGTEGGTVTVTC